MIASIATRRENYKYNLLTKKKHEQSWEHLKTLKAKVIQHSDKCLRPNLKKGNLPDVCHSGSLYNDIAVWKTKTPKEAAPHKM